MAKAKPVKLGIVGIGRAGWSMHCGELEGRERKFQIVAACDTIKARRDMMARRYRCKTYAKIEGLLAEANVELVSIATRSCDHFKHTKAALKAGKTVFLEKPICLTCEEAKKLKTAAARSRGDLYIRHNRRFEPGFQHIREIIDSGLLGKVYEIKLRRGGFQRRDDWQTLKKFGGGQLLNWGPHIIDHALQYLKTPPVSIWSELKCVAALGDAEDYLKVILRGKDGLVVDLVISGGQIVPEPEYIVTGTKGALSSTGDSISLRYMDPKRKAPARRVKTGTPDLGGFGSPDKLKWIEKTIKVSPKTRCTMDGIWDHLFSAIREGKPFPIKLDEAVAVMKIVSEAKRGTAFA